jgi:hypothetical protein
MTNKDGIQLNITYQELEDLFNDAMEHRCELCKAYHAEHGKFGNVIQSVNIGLEAHENREIDEDDIKVGGTDAE